MFVGLECAMRSPLLWWWLLLVMPLVIGNEVVKIQFDIKYNFASGESPPRILTLDLLNAEATARGLPPFIALNGETTFLNVTLGSDCLDGFFSPMAGVCSPCNCSAVRLIARAGGGIRFRALEPMVV